MNFWKSFPKSAVLKQLFFVLALFAILIPVAIWDSNTQVKVQFDSSGVFVRSDKYNMSILYEDIESVQLEPLAAPGEKVRDAFDNNILRCGIWHNDTWGEYTICADPDTGNCVVIRLKDGGIMIFSQKNDETTRKQYETLQSYLQ